jgi:predicted dehydrogenase
VLRHASIGASGQALSDIVSLARHPGFQLVAVADVDLCRIEPLQQRFPAVRVYQDWRELLDRERKHIDSVSVGIPDHMHCLVAMKALKAGKSVYVEKPLCNTLHETRRLTEYARRRGLTTQMGIQVSSAPAQLYGEALVRSGIVGKVKEVHTFSNKNWGDDKPVVVKGEPVPAPLNWDGWLGVNQPRPFVKGAYHPGEWRRRIGCGTGTLGDMGCHIYSPPYRALKLSSPVSVTSHGPAPTPENWATRARVKLTYPGTEYTAGSTVDVWWYDGGELPPDAVREPIGARFPAQGSVLVGTEGLLVLPHQTAAPFAVSGGKTLTLPEIAVPERDHYREFVDAVLGGHKQPCSAGFDYAGPLTESVLMGNVAVFFPGETLAFDARTLSFPTRREANEHLTRTYRQGWGI